MNLPNIFGISPMTADIIGFAGMACIVFAYAYLTGARSPNPFVLHGINLLGAVLLAISLTVNTNMASMVLEFFWGGIAIWGLVKAFGQWRRRRA
jgi:hypothetical protein